MRALVFILVTLSLTGAALAQSAPNWSYGYVPSAGEVRNAFATKQDVLSFSPLNQAGGTMNGKLQTMASTVNGAGFAILPGATPSSPTNGDLWLTSIGLFARINGQNVQFAGTNTYLSIGNALSEITGAGLQSTARSNIAAAASGANTDITSLSGLTTPLAQSEGGIGATSLTGPSGAFDNAFGSSRGSLIYRGAASWVALPPGSAGQVLSSGGSNANPSWVAAGGTGTVTSVGTSSGLTGGPITTSGTLSLADYPMQVRLTLTSGTPIMASTVNATNTVYITPYNGRLVSLWNGSDFVAAAFSELTLSTTGLAASNVYDVFLWSNGSTVTASFGPAWTAGATAGSNAARGSGSGSTALTRVNGVITNVNAIAGGPAAGYGTYLGTIATDSSGATVSFNTGSVAAGGGAATIGLWNAYNRVSVSGQVRDNTSQWSYATAATWRAANASANNRITFVIGRVSDTWSAFYTAHVIGNTSGFTSVAVGLNTTTSYSGTTGFVGSSQIGVASTATATAQPQGLNYFSANEYVASGSSSFYGSGGSGLQSGLTWSGQY